MMRAVVAFAAVLIGAPSALGHVAIEARSQPAGGASDFTVHVPNERPNAGTIRVTLRLPENLVLVRAETPGWRARLTSVPRPTPLRVAGTRIDERVTTVTWTGGRIKPGAKENFRLRFRVVEGTKRRNLAFPAVQEYSNGEIVRWIGPAGSDAPLALLEGPVRAIAATPVPPEVPETAEPTTPTTTQAGSTPPTDDDGSGSGLVLGLVGGGVLAALAVAGAVVLRRRKRS